MARLEARTRRVTRWRTSDQKLRWCASSLWAMERQFRRVKQYRQLPLLKRALQARTSLTKTAAASAASSAASPECQLGAGHSRQRRRTTLLPYHLPSSCR